MSERVKSKKKKNRSPIFNLNCLTLKLCIYMAMCLINVRVWGSMMRIYIYIKKIVNKTKIRICLIPFYSIDRFPFFLLKNQKELPLIHSKIN